MLVAGVGFEVELVWEGCKVVRSESRVFHRSRAACSAERMVVWASSEDVEGEGQHCSEFVAMSAFWSFMRVFRKLSKVERWCLMALPLAASAFAAADILERVVFWESAIILRSWARSDCCFELELGRLDVALDEVEGGSEPKDSPSSIS